MTAACPACAGAMPDAPRGAAAGATHALMLPDIHCGGCIASVERALTALPGVVAARVNLTLKRVAVKAPGLDDATLIDALASAGHRAERLDSRRLAPADGGARDLLTRIGVAGFAMMNVMLLSVAVWSGASGATAQVFHLVSAAIAIPAVAYAAQPFFLSGWGALSRGRLNMDVPISLAILLASLASLASAFGWSERAGWFDAALALTFFLLVGRYLERQGRAAARSAAAELAALEAPQARLADGRVVAAEDLAPGDLIEVRPGDRLPADGVITEGRTDLDRSALTGESRPEPAGAGDAVAAGETCLTGAVTVRVARAGAETGLARMAAMVATAESQRTRYTGIADRAARIYAPVVHILGAATFAGWFWATGDGWLSLDIAISVLVITCPCALGLAVPAVATVATARLFRAGVLVKSATALERLSQVDTLAFDKTGTLTTGRPVLAPGLSDAALGLAAGLARGSRHPVAEAVAEAARDRRVAPVAVGDLVERPGQGVEGTWRGRRVRLGHPDWVGATAVGGATAWLGTGDGDTVAIRCAETLAEGAADAAAALNGHYATAILSGDGAEAVDRVAAATGLSVGGARMRPGDKLDWIARTEADGARVCMVGDGLNDTGSLAAAHAAMSPGTALDAARVAADVILLRGGLSAVPRTLAVARTAMARMRQNIGLAVAYNLISIPLAVAGFASPLVAALAMSLSSLTVTLNAVRTFR